MQSRLACPGPLPQIGAISLNYALQFDRTLFAAAAHIYIYMYIQHARRRLDKSLLNGLIDVLLPVTASG